MSTGEFAASEIHIRNLAEQIDMINPSEILISKREKEKSLKNLIMILMQHSPKKGKFFLQK